MRVTFGVFSFLIYEAYLSPSILTNPPEGDRSGGGAGLGLGGVEEKLRKRVEEKSRAETRLDFGSSIGGCSP